MIFPRCKFEDRLFRQQAGAATGGDPPRSLLSEVNRVMRGTNNMDTTLDEFLTHVETDKQQYFIERLKEYEAMLHLVGLLAGVVGTDKEQKDARDAIVAAITQFIAGLEGVAEEYRGVPSLEAALGAKLVEFLFDDAEWAENIREGSRMADRMTTDVIMKVGDAIVGFFKKIWSDLKKWYNDFWALYDSEGLLIAMNRLHTDLQFFAAEVAIDIAIGAALTVVAGPVSVAAAAALKGLRFTGMRIGRGVTRVMVSAIPDGIPNPRVTRMVDIDIPDSKIAPRIDEIMDEDRIGGISTLNDVDANATPNSETPTTTQVLGDDPDAPPPAPDAVPELSRAERDRLRSATPTQSIRDAVNEGQPIATPENPVADPWLDGFQRTGRLEADHIVPASHIMDKPGFSQLTNANQKAVLNMPENFHGLSRSANGSRGNKTF